MTPERIFRILGGAGFLIVLLLAASCAHKARSTEQVSVAAPADFSQQSGPEGLRHQAIQLYEHGDYLQAMHLIEAYVNMTEATAEDPIFFPLFYCYLSIGRYEQALEISKKIVKARAYDSRSYFIVGVAQLWSGQPAKALSQFRRTLDFEAHWPRAHFYEAIALSQLKRTKARDKAFELAVKEYNQILKRNPSDFRANYELAHLYLYWERHQEKVPALIRAAQLGLSDDSEEDSLRNEKIYRRFHLARIEAIERSVAGAAQLSNEKLWFALGGVPSGARAEVAEIYFYLARNHLALDHAKTAKVFLKKSLDLDPNGPYANRAKELIKKSSVSE